MQSGFKLDSYEQRRLGQLINVTNTWWEGKTQTAKPKTATEIRKMVTSVSQPSKRSFVVPSRVQFLFLLFTVDPLTLLSGSLHIFFSTTCIYQVLLDGCLLIRK